MSKERYYSEYGLIIDRTKIGIEENVSVYDEDFHTIDDLCDLLNQQNQRIAELEQENESYQKLINDICNKHIVGSLKGLDEKLENLEDLNVKFIEIANEFAERNKELEEQLKNAIVPKFKIGQEVYLADTYFDKVYDLKISSISIFRSQHSNHISYDGHLEDSLFATKEDALAKLKELKGEQYGS